MQSLMLTLVAYWCLASVAQASTLLNDPSLLPRPRQHKDRVLVATTLADINTRGPAVLNRQLEHFVAACDAGFEIHLVIVTLTANWTTAEHLFAPSR